MTSIPPIDPKDLLKHTAWAHNLARSLVGESAAQDLVQDTWLAAMQNPPEGDRPLRPWLGTVLGNLARKRTRSQSRRRAREQAAGQHEALPSAATLTERAETQKVLMEALLALDSELRELLLLRYVENHSAAAIAREMGVPVTTIKSRTDRGLALLREDLDRKHGGSREVWATAFAPLLLIGKAGTPIGLGTGIATTQPLYKTLAMNLATLPASLLLTLIAGTLGLLFFEPLSSLVSEPVAQAPSSLLLASPAPISASAGLAPLGLESELLSSRALVSEFEEDPESASQKGNTVAIRFVDSKGAPIAGVEAYQWLPTPEKKFKSDSDGRVQVRFELRDDIKLRQVNFSHPSFASNGLSVELDAGSVTDLGEIVLRPGGRLQGRVVDQEGKAVAGIRLQVQGSPTLKSDEGLAKGAIYRNLLGAGSAVSEADGAFLMSGLLPGEVHVETGGGWLGVEFYFRKSGPLEIIAGQLTKDVVVIAHRVPMGERLGGIVLSPSGAPQPRCGVSVTCKRLTGTWSSTSQTDGEGRFALIASPAAGYSIEIKPPRGEDWNTIVRHNVPAGELNHAFQFEQGDRMALHVEDEAGQPVGEYAVKVDQKGFRGFANGVILNSQSEGRADFALPAESFSLTVTAPGFYEKKVGPFDPAKIKSNAEPLKVTLVSALRVTGVVRGGGQVLANAKVLVQQVATRNTHHNGFPSRFSDSRGPSTKSAKDGKFYLSPTEPGAFVVRVEKEGFAPREFGPFESNDEDGPPQIDAELSKGGSLRGVVRAGEAGSVAGMYVAISRGDSHMLSKRLEEDGLYHFANLTPGPWMVRLKSAAGGDQSSSTSSSGRGAPFTEIVGDCEILEGKETDYGDRLAPPVPAKLSGQLVLGQADLSGWTVSLSASTSTRQSPGFLEGSQVKRSLDAKGNFTLGAPIAGLYSLRFSGPRDYEMGFTSSVTLTAGENRWSLDVPVVSATVEATEAFNGFIRIISEKGDRYMMPLFMDRDETRELPFLPAGSGRLVSYVGDAEPVVFDVVEGEPLHLQVPQ